MNNFIYTVGTSFVPLHEKALKIAEEVGPVEMEREGKKSKILNAFDMINNQVKKDRIGFKRKFVRC